MIPPGWLGEVVILPINSIRKEEEVSKEKENEKDG